MLDPCFNCQRCKVIPRREDCLSPYPNLRAIGNSPGGFAAAHPMVWYGTWSLAEMRFYDTQIKANYPVNWWVLPPIL